MVKKKPLFKTKHAAYHYPLLCGGALLWCLDLYINCFRLIYSQRDATARRVCFGRLHQKPFLTIIYLTNLVNLMAQV